MVFLSDGVFPTLPKSPLNCLNRLKTLFEYMFDLEVSGKETLLTGWRPVIFERSGFKFVVNCHSLGCFFLVLEYKKGVLFKIHPLACIPRLI